MGRSHLSIRTRIIVMVLGTLILGQIFSTYFIHKLIGENILNQKLTTVEVLTTSILHDITYTGTDDLAATGQKIVAKYMTYYRTIGQMSIYAADSTNVAASDPKLLGTRAQDPDILAAITMARPSEHVSRPDLADIGIRSVAPILRGSQIVGAVCIDISIQDLKVTMGRIDRHLLLIVVLKLAVVVVALFILFRVSILSRLRRLMDMTRQLTLGNYDSHVEDQQGDEIGELTRALNRMAADLRQSHEAIEGHNRQLEERVKLATSELQKAYEDLKNTQGQLVLNEKMASLGVLISGVAHEINTPVGAILNVSRTLDHHLGALPEHLRILQGDPAVSMDHMVEFLRALRESASQTRESLSLREQRQISSLLRDQGVSDWQRRSTILCRFNFVDPSLISRHIECVKNDAVFAVAESFASVAQAGTISQTSSQRISEIVRALKFYAYSDTTNIEPLSVNDSITTALVLLRNQLKHSVEVVTDFDPGLPLVACSSEIHQVWTNLIANACDAIAENSQIDRGRISIQTRRDDDNVVVCVLDNGAGIPPGKVDRIFDPFFTTKDIGKGTGLGLSIVSGIISRNGGTIRVESVPGSTAFYITLPVRGAGDKDGARPANDGAPETLAKPDGESMPPPRPADERAA